VVRDSLPRRLFAVTLLAAAAGGLIALI